MKLEAALQAAEKANLILYSVAISDRAFTSIAGWESTAIRCSRNFLSPLADA
jgi:hypothetical protein